MKISQNDLKRIINEEIQALKEKNVLNEEYKVVLNKLENMSYEELHEAVLGRLAQKVGSAVGGALSKGASAATSAAKSALASAGAKVTATAEKAKNDLMKMYDEAKQEELNAIMDKARQDAKKSVMSIVNNYMNAAVKKGIPNPDITIQLILTGILQDLSKPTGQVLPPGPPSTTSSISGASLGRAAVGEE